MAFDPPFNWRLELSPCAEAGAGEPDFRALPARPGVAVFEADDGRTVLIASGADVRELARRRLGAPDAGATATRRADLRAVTARVLACTVGSAFEADAVCLVQARRRLIGGHRSLLTRRQGWFVHIDPEAAHPRWSKTPLPGADEGVAAPVRRGALLGPFRDKHAAQSYIELLDDLFDLCRYHHVLVQAPRGAPCAYKEMGRCPAPCDGSESMESYRSRTADAIAFGSGGAPEFLEACERRMRRASETMDFEAAAREKSLLERAARAAKPAFRHVDSIDRFRWLIVGRSENPGWARLTLASRGRLLSIADVDAGAGPGAVDAAWDAVERALRDDPAPALTGEEEQAIVGLVATALLTARRAEEFVPVGRGADEGARRAIADAVKRVVRLKRTRAAGPEPALADQEIDAIA